MERGRFVTFEGGDGAGKSTQARLLVAALADHGIEAILTREPGGSPFAEVIRRILLDPSTPRHSALAEALLFYAARADHISDVIRPALGLGRWVISDRFSDSTRVYQGHAGALDLRAIETLETLVVGRTAPDLTFIIDIPAELGLARAAMRRTGRPQPGSGQHGAARDGIGPDAYEARDLAFHQRLREGFLAIARAEPERCVVINGEDDEATAAAKVWSAVSARLISKGR